MSGARRPTAPAPTSSSRPSSSSARVWRTTRRVLISAATTAAKTPVRQTVSPPTVEASYSGPYRARREESAPMPAAKACRASAVP